MNDSELMAIVSEMVLGYREGSAPDIIQAIAKLKCTQHKYNEVQGVHELFEKCEELGEMAKEIRIAESE